MKIKTESLNKPTKRKESLKKKLQTVLLLCVARKCRRARWTWASLPTAPITPATKARTDTSTFWPVRCSSSSQPVRSLLLAIAGWNLWTFPPLRRPQPSEALQQFGPRWKVRRLHQRQLCGREWLRFSSGRGFLSLLHLRQSCSSSSAFSRRATREPERTSRPKGPSGPAERTSGGWSGSRTSEWLSWSLTSKRKDGYVIDTDWAAEISQSIYLGVWWAGMFVVSVW